MLKLTNKETIVMDKLLNGRSKGLIDQPGETGQNQMAAENLVHQPNVRNFSNLAPFNNCAVVRRQWKQPKIVPSPEAIS